MATTEVSTAPVQIDTDHGTVTFYTYATSPDAAGRELVDAGAFMTQFRSSKDDGEVDVWTPGDIAAAVSAGSAVVGNIFQAGMLATSIANTVATYQNLPNSSSASQPQQGEAEIIFTNNASVPLAYTSSKSAGCQVGGAPTLLTVGQSDSLLLTRDKPIDGSSQVATYFRIGSGAEQTDGTYAQIPINLYFNYSATANVWTLSLSVDGSGQQSDSGFPSVSALASCTFVPTAAQPQPYPAFSIYFTPVETSSGSVQVAVYDAA